MERLLRYLPGINAAVLGGEAHTYFEELALVIGKTADVPFLFNLPQSGFHGVVDFNFDDIHRILEVFLRVTLNLVTELLFFIPLGKAA